MICKIERVSINYYPEDAAPPVKGAFLGDHPRSGKGETPWVVEINTIEELIELVNEAGNDIIVDKNGGLFIYDDYVE